MSAAIVTSHNIIVVHNHLIRFPDIAFFVSPIPLHIAAMVILYGHMSRCERIPHQVALEDVWMALDMLPSFRWRWERKDLNGGHPLIAKLAEKVLDVNLHQVAPTGAPVLLSEQDWESESIFGPGPKQGPGPGQSPKTPTTGTPHYGGGSVSASYVPGPVQVKTSGSPIENGQPPKMPELPQYYFYPFFPENGPTNGPMATIGYSGYQPSDQYVLEEKDTAVSPTVNTMQMQQQQQQWNGVSRLSQWLYARGRFADMCGYVCVDAETSCSPVRASAAGVKAHMFWVPRLRRADRTLYQHLVCLRSLLLPCPPSLFPSPSPPCFQLCLLLCYPLFLASSAVCFRSPFPVPNLYPRYHSVITLSRPIPNPRIRAAS